MKVQILGWASESYTEEKSIQHLKEEKRKWRQRQEQETSPRDVKENGGSERAAELNSEDGRLKEIRGGYIYIYNSLFVLFAPV